MEILRDHPLLKYNTLQIPAQSKYFAIVKSEEDIEELHSPQFLRNQPMLVLGGGSNILFRNNYDGLILKNEIKGIHILKEDKEHAYIEVGAGENWHEFIKFCINKNLGGLENLSLIPGCVGAAPIQNIGAYGVEQSDTFQSLVAINLETQKRKYFSKPECQFGYRQSIFKTQLKNQFIITRVTYKLDKLPTFRTEYGDISNELKRINASNLSIKTVSKAICNIRQQKLPDPTVIGNAGSFFKNPIVSKKLFHHIQQEFPDIPGYIQPENTIKIPAGWLIEQCGWKGKKEGNASAHENQALVIVNLGGATGEEIFQFSEKIADSVNAKFNISLEREVNII